MLTPFPHEMRSHLSMKATARPRGASSHAPIQYPGWAKGEPATPWRTKTTYAHLFTSLRLQLAFGIWIPFLDRFKMKVYG